MTTDTEMGALLQAPQPTAGDTDAQIIEVLTFACMTSRDFIRREFDWPYGRRSLWADTTLKMLDAVIERAEAQS